VIAYQQETFLDENGVVALAHVYDTSIKHGAKQLK